MVPVPFGNNHGVIFGDDDGDENPRRRRNLLLKVTVLSCLVKLRSKTAGCEIKKNCRRDAKTVFTKAPLSLTSLQGHLFCCKTKTTKYAQLLKYKSVKLQKWFKLRNMSCNSSLTMHFTNCHAESALHCIADCRSINLIVCVVMRKLYVSWFCTS